MKKLEEKLAALDFRLRRYRYSFNNEKELQGQIRDVLLAAPEEWWSEYVLSPRERPDFFCKENGIALEVKIAGSFTFVMRQLARYASHQCVNALVLVSHKPYKCPATLAGKPLRNIALWKSSL